MLSTGLGLLLLSLVSGDVLIICGGDLAHIDLETGDITPSVGSLHTYPNDVIIHDGYGYVVNSGVDTGALQRFEIGTWTLDEMTIGSGWNCWAAIPLSDGNLAVSATLNNSLEIIDPSTMQIVSSVAGVGPSPEWMARDGSTVYAACGGWGTSQQVVSVDVAAGTVADTLTAGLNCQSVVLHGTELFATCSGAYGSDEGCAVVIDLASGTAVDTLMTGGFPGYSTAAGDILYMADPWGAGVYSIDMGTRTVVHDASDPFCTGGNGMAVDDLGNLWITDGMTGEVRVYDTQENLVHTYSVSSPGPIAVSGAFTGIESGNPVTGPPVSVFPNPSFGAVSVRNASPEGSVTVYDITGRIAISGRAGADGTCVLDLSSLRPGLYSVASGTSSARLAVTSR